MTLREILDQATRYTPLTVKRIRSSANAFERFLGRQAQHGDLCQEQIDRFLDWLRDQGRTANAVRSDDYRLRSLWQDAARLGLVPHPTVPRAPLDDPPAGTLWEVFVVYAGLHLVTRSRASWERILRAIRQFGHFLRRDPRPEDLTDKKFASFRKWLKYSGTERTDDTCERHIQHLYTIWRFAANAAYVDRLPTVKRKNRYYRDEDGKEGAA